MRQGQEVQAKGQRHKGSCPLLSLPLYPRSQSQSEPTVINGVVTDGSQTHRLTPRRTFPETTRHHRSLSLSCFLASRGVKSMASSIRHLHQHPLHIQQDCTCYMTSITAQLAWAQSVAVGLAPNRGICYSVVFPVICDIRYMGDLGRYIYSIIPYY